ncbi:hypothetical protein XBKQ1_2420030 [Xenorhabdus bovienii str. kraussei Quebec]|uniref:Uncharacterized protein n=2 Tax=Xenorhabdus bovienii TaxID=40576 RepID=A0A077P6I0_XENBV|nr:hypothetical protein XBKQ1_2420030 [Xenorhabdus bovienii str. kraussei Quebec]CDH33634.1 hypothetical protein XBI1_2740027 [Xenorhabdus bovienii str. Intermedium]
MVTSDAEKILLINNLFSNPVYFQRINVALTMRNHIVSGTEGKLYHRTDL